MTNKQILAEFISATLIVAAEHPDWFPHFERKDFETDYEYALALYMGKKIKLNKGTGGGRKPDDRL